MKPVGAELAVRWLRSDGVRVHELLLRPLHGLLEEQTIRIVSTC